MVPIEFRGISGSVEECLKRGHEEAGLVTCSGKNIT